MGSELLLPMCKVVLPISTMRGKEQHLHFGANVCWMHVILRLKAAIVFLFSFFFYAGFPSDKVLGGYFTDRYCSPLPSVGSGKFVTVLCVLITENQEVTVAMLLLDW